MKFVLLIALVSLQAAAKTEDGLKTAFNRLKSADSPIQKIVGDLKFYLSPQDSNFLVKKMKPFFNKKFSFTPISENLVDLDVGKKNLRLQISKKTVVVAGMKNFYNPNMALELQWHRMENRIVKKLNQSRATSLFFESAEATPVAVAAAIAVTLIVGAYMMLDQHSDCSQITGYARRCEDAVAGKRVEDMESLARFGIDWESRTKDRFLINCGIMREDLRKCLTVAYTMHRQRLNINPPSQEIMRYVNRISSSNPSTATDTGR